MTQESEIVEALLARLEENDKLDRKHADFWNTARNSSTELGVTLEILDHVAKKNGSNLVEWGPVDDDPPDTFILLENDARIGVEVTEIVNQKAIEDRIKRSPRYSSSQLAMDVPEAAELLRARVARKSALMESVEGYSSLVLLAYTDEMLLTSESWRTLQPRIDVTGTVFDAVYLLFSYEPSVGNCPVIEVSRPNGA